MAAPAGRVGVHGAEVVGILAASDHGEDHCEMCPDEEAVGQSTTEGVELVGVYIAHQGAHAVQLGVDFDDHACRIRATLRRMEG